MTGKATEDNASGPLLGLGLSEGLGVLIRSMPMSEEEFLNRATHRYVDRAGLDYAQARDCALGLWNNGEALEDMDTDTPESLVDEDLTYWTDDGDA